MTPVVPATSHRRGIRHFNLEMGQTRNEIQCL